MPTCHLLLCGPADGWETNQLGTLLERYGGLVAGHRLARDAAPGVLHDVNGQAFARLGVAQAAHYLVRPDGHIGYRSAGTDLHGVGRYLARWFPGDRRKPDDSSPDEPATTPP